MSWKDEHKKKLTSLEGAAKQVKSGETGGELK
jgi:hypothetical protein